MFTMAFNRERKLFVISRKALLLIDRITCTFQYNLVSRWFQIQGWNCLWASSCLPYDLLPSSGRYFQWSTQLPYSHTGFRVTVSMSRSSLVPRLRWCALITYWTWFPISSWLRPRKRFHCTHIRYMYTGYTYTPHWSDLLPTWACLSWAASVQKKDTAEDGLQPPKRRDQMVGQN